MFFFPDQCGCCIYDYNVARTLLDMLFQFLGRHEVRHIYKTLDAFTIDENAFGLLTECGRRYEQAHGQSKR